MERNYNYIYEKLVESENDLIGHIAYSIYKSNKIEFIEKFKKGHDGVAPTEEDLRPFHDMSCTDSTISLYLMKAESLLQDFMGELWEDFHEEIENDCIKNQNQHLEKIIEPIKPNKWKQFWQSLWASLLGAFLFALLVATIAFIKSNNRSDGSVNLSQEIEQMIEDALSKRDIPSTVELTDQDGNVGEQQYQ